MCVTLSGMYDKVLGGLITFLVLLCVVVCVLCYSLRVVWNDRADQTDNLHKCQYICNVLRRQVELYLAGQEPLLRLSLNQTAQLNASDLVERIKREQNGSLNFDSATTSTPTSLGASYNAYEGGMELASSF